MKDDNTHMPHRGSSPPYQDPEQDFYRWMNGLKSMGQRDETAPDITIATPSSHQPSRSTDLKDDSRLQDDGGESGEAH